jgi:hypothetical protein
MNSQRAESKHKVNAWRALTVACILLVSAEVTTDGHTHWESLYCADRQRSSRFGSGPCLSSVTAQLPRRQWDIDLVSSGGATGPGETGICCLVHAMNTIRPYRVLLTVSSPLFRAELPLLRSVSRSIGDASHRGYTSIVGRVRNQLNWAVRARSRAQVPPGQHPGPDASPGSAARSMTASCHSQAAGRSLPASPGSLPGPALTRR